MWGVHVCVWGGVQCVCGGDVCVSGGGMCVCVGGVGVCVCACMCEGVRVCVWGGCRRSSLHEPHDMYTNKDNSTKTYCKQFLFQLFVDGLQYGVCLLERSNGVL